MICGELLVKGRCRAGSISWPRRCVLLRWVYFTANGKIMSTEFGKVATNFFQRAISTSLRAALRMFSYRSRSVWVNQMTGGLLGSRPGVNRCHACSGPKNLFRVVHCCTVGTGAYQER